MTPFAPPLSPRAFARFWFRLKRRFSPLRYIKANITNFKSRKRNQENEFSCLFIPILKQILCYVKYLVLSVIHPESIWSRPNKDELLAQWKLIPDIIFLWTPESQSLIPDGNLKKPSGYWYWADGRFRASGKFSGERKHIYMILTVRKTLFSFALHAWTLAWTSSAILPAKNHRNLYWEKTR